MVRSYTIRLLRVNTYQNISKYWDRKAFVNSVDPDQMLQNAASD